MYNTVRVMITTPPPGDYATTLGTGSLANCQQQFYSCVGLPEGPNPVPGRLIETQYIMCQDGRTLDVVTCPGGQIYEPQQKICTMSAEQGTMAQWTLHYMY